MDGIREGMVYAFVVVIVVVIMMVLGIAVIVHYARIIMVMVGYKAMHQR